MNMANKKIPNHFHRYKRVNLSPDKKYLVYKCQKPACSHYVPLALAEGKMCECNRCYNLMIITKTQLQSSHGGSMAKPHCNNCIKRKTVDEQANITEFLNEIGVSYKGVKSPDDTY